MMQMSNDQAPMTNASCLPLVIGTWSLVIRNASLVNASSWIGRLPLSGVVSVESRFAICRYPDITPAGMPRATAVGPLRLPRSVR